MGTRLAESCFVYLFSLLPWRFGRSERIAMVKIGRRQEEADVGGGERRLLRPNVRAKRATTAGRQRSGGENVPRTTGRALVACRWRSA